MTSINTIDFEDIQGLVRRGFGSLPAASYLLIGIGNVKKALPWLRKLTHEITYSNARPEEKAINLAITFNAMKKLNIKPTILDSFSDDFRLGMTSTHKRHILGDEGNNAPEYWSWGGPATQAIDLILLCYARDDETLNSFTQQLLKDAEINGLNLIEKLATEALLDGKEHFGFKDSIGQPFIEEFSSKKAHSPHPIALGEILLGYTNGYDRFTQRPKVAASSDPLNKLMPCSENPSEHDIGLNGSYLVFRQLFQDVPHFWRTLKNYTEKKIEHGASNKKTSDDEHSPLSNQTEKYEKVIKLASKMVGRWPSGTALTEAPYADDISILDKDKFSYHETDPIGLKCPLGAHIRRTNPRDSLKPQPGSEESFAFSNRHRILRRGRAYGKPFDSSMNPGQMLEHIDSETAPVSRGLHFICINANIGRQFEFVQHTWASNPNFNGLYQDPDPIIGSRSINGLLPDNFTIQRHPYREQIDHLPAFVETRGGAYFFLPSRRALSYLLTEGILKK